MEPGEEIALGIDQTLTQDATGTMVMLELEAMDVDHLETELSAQYVDHNLIQEDNKNPDDHLFLRSACNKWGIWFWPAGNGVSHPVHQERFGVPGKTLLGSDSHTPAAGAMGMLAIGAGGLDVAMAMAGESPTTWTCRRCGASSCGANSQSGAARRTSSSRCCDATTSTAASGASSNTTALGWTR
ncbi:aconitase family protein [Halorarius litoreus]|uniref:aconitase family protein n=1 Tax=Halorarius litoreus TaxID=2962676 RepID=UPI0020CC2883|nr:aconitase family protein [Halorarius litoreus]